MRKPIVFPSLEQLFRYLFLIYAFLSFSSVAAQSLIIKPLMLSSFLLGGLLLIQRLFKLKQLRLSPAIWPALGFLASYLLSMLIFLRYEAKNNLLHLIYLAFYLLILYLNRSDADHAKRQKEFERVVLFYVILMTIAVIASIIMLIIGYGRSETIEPDGYQIIRGFWGGRLWGVFQDPNNGAVMALAAIWLCLFLFSRSKNRLYRSFLSCSAALQLYYIAMSGSRTAAVCLFFSGGLAALIFLLLRRARLWRALLLSLSIALLLAASPFMIRSSTNWIYQQTQDQEQAEDEDLFDRGYDLEEDISNRRFDIWKSGLEIFAHSPLIGTSYYGIRPFAREKLPKTYIINNDQIAFRNLHNEWINVAAAQGILGLAFMIWALYLMIRRISYAALHCAPQRRLAFCACLGALLTIGCSAMFLSAGMFYYFSPATLLFWMVAGALERGELG